MALDLATARDRIRLAVGDTDEADVLMPDGLGTYTTLLTQADADEVAAYRAAAGALAAYWATQPVSLSASGKSLNWSERVSSWQAMANGSTPYPFAAVVTTGTPPALPAVAAFATIPGRRGR
jgi:hypothetical protein